MVLFTTYFLVSAVHGASFQQYFLNITNNSSYNLDQLGLLINLSKDLVRHHLTLHKGSRDAEQLERALSNVCSHDDVIRFTQEIVACLDRLRRFAVFDSTLAILGRRLLLACIILRIDTLNTTVSKGEIDEFFTDVARQVRPLEGGNQREARD